MEIKSILLVFIGGGLGSSIRYAIGLFFKSTSQTYPAPTLIANLVGCFLIGVFVSLLYRLDIIKDQTYLFLVVGFCGGLTTFSSFSLDLLNLSQSSMLDTLLYFLANVIGGMFLLMLGLTLTKYFYQP